MSVVWSLLYRYMQAFPGWITDLFEQSRLIYVFYAFCHLILYGIIAIPFVLGTVNDKEKMKRQFLIENSDMAHYSNVQMICFVNNDTSTFLGLLFSLTNLLFFLLGTTLTGFLFLRIKSSKHEMMFSSTHKLQLMLLKAFLVQLINGYLFLLFPVAFVGLMIYYRVKNTGKICSILLAVMSTHGLMDYLTMLRFISPYKRVILKWMRIPEKLNGCESFTLISSFLEVLWNKIFMGFSTSSHCSHNHCQ